MALTHPRLAHALMALRPGTKPLINFIVEMQEGIPTLKDGSMVGPPTQAEVDAVSVSDLDLAQKWKGKPIPTIDQIYDDAILSQRVLKAVILALNDGTFPIGTNKTGAQLKAIIKAKM